MKKTIIISAFPGTGKSYTTKELFKELSFKDSDSSNFSWVKDSEGNNTSERNPDFPNNYIKHILEEKESGKYDYIFVSSHGEVREALVEANIKWVLIYPDNTLINEYIERYKNRGSSEQFIKIVQDGWNNWISDLEVFEKDNTNILKLKLIYGEYVSDIISELEYCKNTHPFLIN